MMQSRLQIFPGFAPGYITRVRVLIQHPMETGFRFDMDGKAVPKNVIHTLTADFDGARVFKATLGSGISADPFLEFQLRTPHTGELVLRWVDDAGDTGEARAHVVVPH
jgi:sulfur-oxidizing protein SoxZ